MRIFTPIATGLALSTPALQPRQPTVLPAASIPAGSIEWPVTARPTAILPRQGPREWQDAPTGDPDYSTTRTVRSFNIDDVAAEEPYTPPIWPPIEIYTCTPMPGETAGISPNVPAAPQTARFCNTNPPSKTKPAPTSKANFNPFRFWFDDKSSNGKRHVGLNVHVTAIPTSTPPPASSSSVTPSRTKTATSSRANFNPFRIWSWDNRGSNQKRHVEVDVHDSATPSSASYAVSSSNTPYAANSPNAPYVAGSSTGTPTVFSTITVSAKRPSKAAPQPPWFVGNQTGIVPADYAGTDLGDGHEWLSWDEMQTETWHPNTRDPVALYSCISHYIDFVAAWGRDPRSRPDFGGWGTLELEQGWPCKQANLAFRIVGGPKNKFPHLASSVPLSCRMGARMVKAIREGVATYSCRVKSKWLYRERQDYADFMWWPLGGPPPPFPHRDQKEGGERWADFLWVDQYGAKPPPV